MFQDILKSHFTRYPEMQIQDVYKLIYQAALGSEHAVMNRHEACVRLEREIMQLGDEDVEPAIVDPISADGQIVRVHLRPFLAENGDPEALLTAFVRTANEFHGDEQVLKNYWDIATHLGFFPPAAMDDFIQSMKGYPAMHHSAIYTQRYRPAYRVILQKYL
jgi:hypothetical protein